MDENKQQPPWQIADAKPDLLAIAVGHHQSRRSAEAEAAYRQALDARPDFPEAYKSRQPALSERPSIRVSGLLQAAIGVELELSKRTRKRRRVSGLDLSVAGPSPDDTGAAAKCPAAQDERSPLAFLHFCVYNRNGIFAFRAAPIQVSYVGFPGSMGAAFIDYLLADRFVIPEALESCYREDVVCLPDTFQCSSSRRIAEQTPTRRELGLPESGFVFCCFNGAYKIRPAIFDIWMAAHEALALQLATQPGLLTALRLRLEADRYTQPLFNVDRFRRHIEAAHQGMWENSAGG